MVLAQARINLILQGKNIKISYETRLTNHKSFINTKEFFGRTKARDRTILSFDLKHLPVEDLLCLQQELHVPEER
jgi:hypothetical protein